MAPPGATLASLQKSVLEVLGKLEGLKEVVAAVEEVQTQANTNHDNHVGMCQQLQRSVEDITQRDPGSDSEGISRAQRANAKDKTAVWRNDAIRRFWILTAKRPAMYNLKRSELQAVLAEVIAVTNRVTNQLNTQQGVRRHRLHGGEGRHVSGRGHVSTRADGRNGPVFADGHRHGRWVRHRGRADAGFRPCIPRKS